MAKDPVEERSELRRLIMRERIVTTYIIKIAQGKGNGPVEMVTCEGCEAYQDLVSARTAMHELQRSNGKTYAIFDREGNRHTRGYSDNYPDSGR